MPTIYMGNEDIHGNNSIYDNGNEGEIYNLYNNTSVDYDAKYNYWGSIDPAEVEDGIFHQNDDESLGLISYEPFLLDFPVSSETIPFKENECNFYPNPVENNIYFTNLVNIKSIYLYSIDGKLIFSKKSIKTSLSLSHLKAGVYILKIASKSGIKHFKLLKK